MADFRYLARRNMWEPGLVTTHWFLFFLTQNQVTGIQLLESIFFFSGALLWSFFLLETSGYFTRLRLRTRWVDAAGLFIATSLAGFLQAGVSLVIFDRVPYTFIELMGLSPLSAAILFSIWRLSADFRLQFEGGRKKIVLDLSDDDRRSFLEAVDEAGLTEMVKFARTGQLDLALSSEKSRDIHAVVTSASSSKFNEKGSLLSAHLAGIPIVDSRAISSDLTGRVRVDQVDAWSYFMTATRQTPLLQSYALLKTIFEPLLAALMAIALAPVALLVAGLIKLTSPGPVLFSQKRLGLGGKSFELLKFRSMRSDSEVKGPQWASERDSRVTPIGKFIRATRLDELPQLWNVMKGEMSFVGPRPERPEFYLSLSRDIPLFDLRLSIRPGISGWAQVCAGYAASVEESKTKLEYDLYYIKHVSPALDLLIILKTLTVALMGSERATAAPSRARSKRRFQGPRLLLVTRRPRAARRIKRSQPAIVESAPLEGVLAPTGLTTSLSGNANSTGAQVLSDPAQLS